MTTPPQKESNNESGNISLTLGLVGLISWYVPLIGFPIALIGLYHGVKGVESTQKIAAAYGIAFCLISLIATTVNATIGARYGYELGKELQQSIQYDDTQ